MAAVCICRRVFFCAQNALLRGRRISTAEDTAGHGPIDSAGPATPPIQKDQSTAPIDQACQLVNTERGTALASAFFPQHLINKERETQLAISVYCIPHWLVRSPITPCGEVIDPYFTPNTVPPRSESSGERGAHFTQCGQAHSNKPDGR